MFSKGLVLCALCAVRCARYVLYSAQEREEQNLTAVLSWSTLTSTARTVPLKFEVEAGDAKFHSFRGLKLSNMSLVNYWFILIWGGTVPVVPYYAARTSTNVLATLSMLSAR